MSEVTKLIAELGENFNSTTSALDARLGELERLQARLPANGNGEGAVVSLARKLTDTAEFKSLQSGTARGRAVVESAAITSANGTVGAGRSLGTSLAPADRLPGIVTPAQRELTVRDLFAPGTTGSASIEYVKETGFTNSAAPVEEGTAKPYSDLTFDLVTAPVRTVAHLFKVSVQMLQDVDGIISYMDLRGTTGLKLVEEAQLLFGNGTGQNLHGIIPQATVFDDTLRKAGDTRIDTIRHAILQVRRAEYRADGIVMHPDDLEALDLTKDEDGPYIISNPVEGGPDRVWRLNIVDTTAMPAGTFLVGAFGTGGAQIFDRQQAVFEISTENSDDFEKNLATARIEQRLALAVYRPESFVSGDFEESES